MPGGLCALCPPRFVTSPPSDPPPLFSLPLSAGLDASAQTTSHELTIPNDVSILIFLGGGPILSKHPRESLGSTPLVFLTTKRGGFGVKGAQGLAVSPKSPLNPPGRGGTMSAKGDGSTLLPLNHR